MALDDSTLIIDVLPPMELHLLLGIVNKLYNHLDEVLKQIPGNEVTAEDWSAQCGLVRPKLHGGEFNGNSCKVLLNSIEKLENLIPEANIELEQILKVFNDLG